MLQESYSERAGWIGCLLPGIICAVLGGLVGHLLAPAEVEGVAGLSSGMNFLYVMAGAFTGLILGIIGGFVFDKIATERRRREDEF